MALKTGRGAAAPPFLVMDVIAAANARAAALPPGAPGDPADGGRPARHRRPARRRRGGDAARCEAGAPMGYTEAFGLRSLRARIAAALCRAPMARRWRWSGSP